MWENRWDESEEKLGPVCTAALKKLYDFYGDNIYKWFARLYEPEIGAFYYSNSARDHEGFLPDIESTSQAVGFFISSGLFRSNDDYPDWFKEKLIYFVKSLQDPNGYIYHPQWDRETLEKNTSRMSRDLGSAYQILQRYIIVQKRVKLL